MAENERIRMASDLPELLGSRDEPVIINQLLHVINETRIRTRQKFHTFFDENFANNEQIERLEYDNDSLVFVSDQAQIIDFQTKPSKPVKRKSIKGWDRKMANFG